MHQQWNGDLFEKNRHNILSLEITNINISFQLFIKHYYSLDNPFEHGVVNSRNIVLRHIKARLQRDNNFFINNRIKFVNRIATRNSGVSACMSIAVLYVKYFFL